VLNKDVKRGVRSGLAGVLVFAAALIAAPVALANDTQSTNWAGYAVHRPGVSFHHVSANWIQPSAACTGGEPSYSSVWVGLGGYSPTSDALEQIGTELDCTAGGKAVSSAWYELVPAPSKNISLVVQPGDAMHASVAVTGNRVVVELDNLTTHRRFRKTLYTDAIDVSSAEWIVEAPSECISQYTCQALPLANFGSVGFESAKVTTGNGAVGTITDAQWARTRISLTPGSQRLIVARGSSDTAGTAAPSTLRGDGSAFDVTFATAPVKPAPALAREAQVREGTGYIRH
jgi:hypothetical protein